MSKIRAKNIDAAIVDAAVKLIDSWPTSKLTWDLLIEALGASGLPTYTRQALDRQPLIKSAYNIRVKTLRTQRSSGVEPPPPVVNLRDARVMSLEATVTRLTVQNGFLLEKFHRWLSNATAAGLSTDELDRPLPDVDRNSRPDIETPSKKNRKHFPKKK